MDYARKKKLIVKICCLVASFCLWIYISIINNPIKTVEVKDVQVELLNTDSIKASQLVIDPDQNLNVNLTAKCNASNVKYAKAGNFKVTADISSYAIKKGTNKIPVEVSKTPDGVSVVNDGAFWVDVEIDSLETKSFTIQSKIEGKAQDGVYMNNPGIKPAQVDVSGPSKYLAKVEKVIAYGSIDSFANTIGASLPLMAIDKSGNEVKAVSLSQNKADVTLVMSKIKTVPVKVVLEGTVDGKYSLDSVASSTENVQITGSDSVLNSIDAISTESININNLGENKEVDAKLILPQGILLVNSESTVNVKINLDKIETKSLDCDIKGINLDNNFNYKFDTNTINVTISGASKKLSSISEKDITATVDLKGYSTGFESLPVNITAPSGINIVSKSTDNIKVTISIK